MGESLGEAVLTLSTDQSKFDTGMETAQQKANKLGANFAKVGLAVSAIGVPLAMMAKSAIDTADNMAKMSRSLGVSVEDLGGLKHAAELSGSSLEEVSIAIKTVSQRAVDFEQGSSEAVASFEALGVSVTDASGNLKSADTIMGEVANRFAAMEDGTAKTALAVDLFGRSGMNLIPMLNQGAEGIQAMKDEAASLGLVFSTEAANAAEGFNDSMLRLKGSFTGFINAIVSSGLIENLTAFVNKSAELISNFAQGHPILVKIVTIFGGISAVLGPVLIAIGAMIPAVAALAPAFAALWTAITGPVGLISIAVAAIAGFVASNEKARTVIKAVWTAIKNAVVSAINWVLEKLNKIPGVNIKLIESTKKVEKAQEAVAEQTVDTAREFERFVPKIEKITGKTDKAEKEFKKLKDRMDQLASTINDVGPPLQKLASRLEKIADDSWDVAEKTKKANEKLADFGGRYVDLDKLAKSSDGLAKSVGGGVDERVGLPGAFNKAKDAAGSLINEVSTIFTNMNQALADNIIHWKGWGQTLISTAEEIAKAILAKFIEHFTSKLLGKVSDAFGDIFGTAASGGASAGAGGIAGGLLSAAGGPWALAGNAIGGALGGLISGFMTKGELSEIEVNTRYTQLGIVGPLGIIDQLWEMIDLTWDIRNSIMDFFPVFAKHMDNTYLHLRDEQTPELRKVNAKLHEINLNVTAAVSVAGEIKTGLVGIGGEIGRKIADVIKNEINTNSNGLRTAINEAVA